MSGICDDATNAAATKIQSMARRCFARDNVHKKAAAVWERICDPVSGFPYYYNRLNGVSQWQEPALLMWHEIEKPPPIITEEQAAILVQCAWRRVIGSRRGREELARVVTQLFDEVSGCYYYFNSQTGTTSWEKPKLFGSSEVDDEKLLCASTLHTGVSNDNHVEEDEEASESADGEEGGETEEEEESPAMLREWPRSKAQRTVDTVEDDPHSATELSLNGIGLTRLSYRIFAVESLTRLDVSSNKLQTLTADVSALSQLQVLDLSRNLLQTLPKELEDLGQLHTLNASENRLESYSPHLYRLASLRDLNLASNKLEALPVAIGDLDLLRETRVWEVGLGMLTNLTRLDASHNELRSWPAQLDALNSLEELDLSNNRLSTTVPGKSEAADCDEDEAGSGDWSGLRRLRRLDISHNRLRFVCSEIGQLTSLETLDLRSNLIKRLPDAIQYLSSLRSLLVDDNQLSRDEATLWELPMLSHMSFARNLIDGFSEGENFCGLAALTDVDYCSNKLREVPKSITKLASLRRLALSRNMLEAMPPLAGFFRLEALLIDRNRFASLPGRQFVSLISLKQLDVSNNALVELPKELGGLSKLKVLDASSNKLQRLSGRSLPASLVELRLAHNQLTVHTLPAAHMAKTLCELRVLSLDFNRLEWLPVELAAAPKLAELTLDHNPFTRHLLDVLEPFKPVHRRARHFKVCLGKSMVSEGASSEAVLRRYNSAELSDRAGAGAERLERGEYIDALAPLAESVAIFDRLYPDAASAATAAHHFLLGAALVAQVRTRDAPIQPRRCSRSAIALLSSRGSMDADSLMILTEGEQLFDPKWKAERFELLLRARHALDAAERIVYETKLGDPHPEVYYCRALAAFEAKDYPATIRDTAAVLVQRPHHAPTIVLQAQARCALGQFPQAQRDCLRARRLIESFRIAQEEGEGKFRHMLDNLRVVEAKASRGLATLHVMGCDDPNFERSFEVTPAGLLHRRNSELLALDTSGRSERRHIPDRNNQRFIAERRVSEDRDRADEEERMHCLWLADKVRADLAWRRARYLEQLEAERKEKKARRKVER